MRKILKYLLLSLKNKGKHIKIHITSNIGFKSSFEGYNVINQKCCFSGHMGYGSYIGEGSNISGQIGRFCSIANNVKVINGTHPTSKFVSTHPAFFSVLAQSGETFVKKQKFVENKYADAEKKYPVIIGNDVWIGSGATILAGVHIGDGAIVVANATVTKDVSPYTIVGGIPAREIKKRFTEKQIDFLLRFKWFDKPIEWIKENSDCFEDIETFINNMENK